MVRRWVQMTVIIGLAFSIIIGCSVSPGEDPPPPELDRKSPENLFRFFADAYERKDIDKYSECLHDEYLYEFDPKDYEAAGVEEDKPWWGKTQDEKATGGMFTDGQVGKVLMDLPIHAGPWTTEEGLGYRLEPSIQVTIDRGAETGPTTYWVFESWLDVEVVEDPYDATLYVFKEITEIVKEGGL